MKKQEEQYKILINAVDPEECRIALVKKGHLENFSIETAARELIRGNIYKGKVARVEPSLQAAFINYGAEKHGFLQQHEIHSDYFAEKVDYTRFDRIWPRTLGSGIQGTHITQRRHAYNVHFLAGSLHSLDAGIKKLRGFKED